MVSVFRFQGPVLKHRCSLTPDTRNLTRVTMIVSISETNTDVDMRIVV